MLSSGNDALVQVKDNQKNLHEGFQLTPEIMEATATYKSSWEKGHGRQEQRTVRVYEDFILYDRQEWEKYIGCLIVVDRTRKERDSKTKEWKVQEDRSYYICTKRLTAKEANQYIRLHWSIENSDHYVRDVTMGEDASRIRKKPLIISTLRSFALNIMRYNKATNISHELYENSLDIEKVLSYKGLGDF